MLLGGFRVPAVSRQAAGVAIVLTAVNLAGR